MGAQTGSRCLLASSAKPIVGVCDEPIPPTILAMSNYPRPPPAGAEALEIELFVERDVVLAAVALVVVHEPPDVGGLDEVPLVVVPLERSLQPAEQLHALGMIADQCVRESRRLVDECPGGCHPVVLEITHAAFEADHDHGTAMLVCADDARRLDP